MNGVPVIWTYTTLGEAKPEDLESYLQELGFTVKFNEEFEDNKGNHHIIFTLLDNIGKFCLFRLRTNDMKWVDDFHDNNPDLLPDKIVKEYII